MSKIKELLNEHERVWFYIENDETRIRFMQEVEKMGGRFLDGSEPKEHSCGRIMAFGRDNRIAYVSLMVWCMSFSEEVDCGKDILKIDYEKYERGEKDFVMKVCNFKRVDQMK